MDKHLQAIKLLSTVGSRSHFIYHEVRKDLFELSISWLLPYSHACKESWKCVQTKLVGKLEDGRIINNKFHRLLNIQYLPHQPKHWDEHALLDGRLIWKHRHMSVNAFCILLVILIILVYTTQVNSAFRAIWLVPQSWNSKCYSPLGGF